MTAKGGANRMAVPLAYDRCSREQRPLAFNAELAKFPPGSRDWTGRERVPNLD